MTPGLGKTRETCKSIHLKPCQIDWAECHMRKKWWSSSRAKGVARMEATESLSMGDMVSNILQKV